MLLTSVSLVSSADNTLYEDPTGSLSDGAGPNFYVGETAGKAPNDARRGLIKFDLSSIPSGATINSVTLALNMSKTSSGAENISLHTALKNWGEGTSNAGANGGKGVMATTGDATWLYTSYNTQQWTTAGGDFTSTASATTSVNGVGSYQWTGAGLVADVQQWVNSPSTNFGWEVLGNESTADTTKQFDTRENSTAADRPTLTIDYSVTSAPDLTVNVSHSASFHQGDNGDTYTISVNNAGGSSTSGTVSLSDALPSGLTATAFSGSGWSVNLATLTATRSDALAAGASYPALTLTVSVASNAPSSVTNMATVSGGGETDTSNDTGSDVTSIGAALTPLIINGAANDNISITFTDSSDFTVTINGGPGTSYNLSSVDRVEYLGPSGAFSKVVFSSLATGDAYTATQAFDATTLFRAGGGFEFDASHVANLYLYVANSNSTATVSVASGTGNFFVDAANSGYSYIADPVDQIYSELSGFGDLTTTGSSGSTYAYVYSTSHATAVGDPGGSTFTVGSVTSTLGSFPQVYFVGASDGTDSVTLHTQGGAFVGQPSFSYASGTFAGAPFLVGGLFAANVTAQATNAADSAFFYSYPGNTFTGVQGTSTLTGSASGFASYATFAAQAAGFTAVTVEESGAGTDVANLTSPGSGTLNVAPTVSTLSVGGVTIFTVDTFFDNNGSFVAVPSKLNVTGNVNGSDTANLNDAPGSNSLVAQGNTATLTTSVNTVTVTQFGKVNAFQNSGSNDTVHQQAIDFTLQTVGNWTSV